MPEAVSNTSSLLYLHRIEAINWLPELFGQVWIPGAVVLELEAGQQKGYDVPVPDPYPWLHVVEPTSMPSAWLALDLGAGELAAVALACNRLRYHPLLWQPQTITPDPELIAVAQGAQRACQAAWHHTGGGGPHRSAAWLSSLVERLTGVAQAMVKQK